MKKEKNKVFTVLVSVTTKEIRDQYDYWCSTQKSNMFTNPLTGHVNTVSFTEFDHARHQVLADDLLHRVHGLSRAVARRGRTVDLDRRIAVIVVDRGRRHGPAR